MIINESKSVPFMIFLFSSLHPFGEDTTAEFVDRNKYFAIYLFKAYVLYCKCMNHLNFL